MDEFSLTRLPQQIETRWASAENWDGARGAAAQSNSGRKGSPCRGLDAGDEFVMAHAEGRSGTVRRIWITINDRTPQMLRGLVLRAYWDGNDTPAIEAPLGDFFGLALGRTAVFQNAWFDNPEGRSFNCRLPMPFRTGFRLTVSNESPVDLGAFFYDVDYTLGDEHDDEVGYLHAHYRRENPTTLHRDFEILPKITGRGRFLGCNLGVIADMATYGRAWWGEGEVKVYLDGDQAYPTLSGTGTEDFIATGWGQGCYAHLWHGCPIADHERLQYAFYRLHGPDPIYFHSDVRVTIQQIGGWRRDLALEHMRAAGIESYVLPGDGSQRMTQAELAQLNPLEFFLYERQDDWCATAYFILDRPVSGLPPIEPYEARVASLTGDVAQPSS